MDRNSLIVACLLACTAASAAEAPPPPARAEPLVERVFGIELSDPYRWMESTPNPELMAWLEAEGAYARSLLDAEPAHDAWGERLLAATRATRVHRWHRVSRDRVYFLRADAGEAGTLLVRDSKGREQPLLDPATLDPKYPNASIAGLSVSPDGKWIAANVDFDGSEATRVVVVDTHTGERRTDHVDRIWSEIPVSWTSDSSAFAYTQMAPADEQVNGDPLQRMRARLHPLGGDPAKDLVLLRTGLNPRVPMSDAEFPVVRMQADSPWALALRWTSAPSWGVCIAPRKAVTGGATPWVCPVEFADEIHDADVRGHTLFLASFKGSPNGRVLALDLRRQPLRLSDAREVFPEAKDGAIVAIASATDALYVHLNRHGLDEIWRREHATGTVSRIRTPQVGVTSIFATTANEPGVIFNVQDWARPRVVYHFRPDRAGLEDLRLGGSSPADYSDVRVIRTEVTSADGTQVPLTVLAPVKPSKNAIALLGGYGEAGMNWPAFFQPLALEWVKAGNVYAVAHVRGGGEKGDAWRAGGSGPLKHNGIEDFLACADALVSSGHVAAGRTVAWGESAGGLLVGGAVNRAPDKFAGAAILVGFLNPARMLAGANGANMATNVGDPRTPEGLKSLVAMDPYLGIREGVKYPPALLSVALDDARVPPWQAAKYGARIKAASSGTTAVLFRTGPGGHLAASMNDEANDAADLYTFAELVVGNRPAHSGDRVASSSAH